MGDDATLDAMSLPGRRSGTAVVTGASRGIGAAIARRLAGSWERVACLSRSGTVPEDLARSTNVIGVSCDVTDEARLRDSLAALAKLGHIGALVNNAGSHVDCRAVDLTTDAFRALLDIDTLAVFAACREVHPYLVASGGGQIINIGSFLDRMGVATQTAYCASKAAVGAITRCLAVEWARDDIQVVNVAPGYVATEMNAEYLASEAGIRLQRRMPLRRPADVDEVARVVESLLSNPSAFLTGTTIYLDGAFGLSL
jgi:NAD(P)-dependent dehydrogenase (short-subunit alcohol dehydrogenase family)